jgi:xanthine dehydrogenase accessory factor
VDLYVEAVLPGLRVVVFGVTPVARALTRIAHAMGYHVDVVDPGAEGSDFPEPTRVVADVSSAAVAADASILVATMDERDLDAIEAAVGLKPSYLGVVASRKRFAELREALEARGVLGEAVEKIVAPAGLDIGARTPEEIALSVMAQIVERQRNTVRAEVKPSADREEPSEAIDPVCGMTVAIGGARHIAELNGSRYYFCCGGCRAKFLGDPARYSSGRVIAQRI